MRSIRRAALPALVFVSVFGIDMAWRIHSSSASRWATVDGMAGISPIRQYLQAHDYWLGLSYALSIAFAAVALRRYREQRASCSPTLAIGGVSLSGVLAVAGCFLIGCCGSPMLAVYVSLFGAGFLPIAKVVIFGLTLLCIVAGYLMMNRSSKRQVSAASCCDRELPVQQ